MRARRGHVAVFGAALVLTTACTSAATTPTVNVTSTAPTSTVSTASSATAGSTEASSTGAAIDTPAQTLASPPAASRPPTPAASATRAAAPTTAVAHPQSGPGTFTTSTVAYPAAGPGRVVSYAVQVETGVPVDASAFAQATRATLTDPRGWQGVDHVAFQEVADPKAASFILTLATPKTTDKLCAPLDTGSWLDCFNNGRAVINSDRWLLGATSWGNDLAGYRQQVVNHEVGHAIGHNHLYCPGPGKPAPVMQQQTISLKGCAPNAWPSVTGG